MPFCPRPTLRGKQVITLGFKQQANRRSRRQQPKVDIFLNLFHHIADFIAENDGGNFKAYFSPTGRGALRLYLVTETEAFIFALSAKLTDYVAPFVERGVLDGVMLLPASSPEELGAFFDLETAFRFEIKDA